MAIAAFFGASLFGVVLAEGVLRLVWTPPHDRSIHSFDFETALQRDSELGYVPKPGAIVEYPPYNATFSINAAGFRGPAIPVDRSVNRQRIAVLGDSFAWGHGVSTGEAFSEVIDAALPNADVINLGVPGYDLAKSLKFYQRVGRDRRPDLVIVSICQNDFRMDDAATHPSDGASRIQASAAPSATSNAPAARSVKQWLHERSYLYQLLQQNVNTSRPLSQLAVAIGLKEELAGFELLDDNLRPALIDGPACVQRSHERVQQQLLSIRDAVRADGARTIVALIPCIQSIDARELAKSIAYTRYEPSDFDLNAPMRMLTRFCDENDMPVVDPTPAFRKAFDQGDALYLPGDLHFNAAGHALFARCILDAIAASEATPSPTNASRPGSR